MRERGRRKAKGGGSATCRSSTRSTSPEHHCPPLKCMEVAGAESLQPELEKRLENNVQLFLESKRNKSVVNG